jgi:hypothetical protein
MEFNTTISYGGIRYEVYWTSRFAEHVLDNYADPNHGVKHTEIVRILNAAGYVEQTPKLGCYLFVSEYAGIVFETYAYLVPVSPLRPAHCVIVTCFRSGRLRSKLTTSVVAA